MGMDGSAYHIRNASRRRGGHRGPPSCCQSRREEEESPELLLHAIGHLGEREKSA
jgi:hypothetical protein